MVRKLPHRPLDNAILAIVLLAHAGLLPACRLVLLHLFHSAQRHGRALRLRRAAAAERRWEAVIRLFWNFLMIGALSFGGGYGMILPCAGDRSVQRLADRESEFLSFIAVSESTPGPLAVNMATILAVLWQGGFWGALVATLGVVLPSFLLLLLIAAVLRNLMKYRGVEAFLSGVRPCVVALILARP